MLLISYMIQNVRKFHTKGAKKIQELFLPNEVQECIVKGSFVLFPPWDFALLNTLKFHFPFPSFDLASR